MGNEERKAGPAEYPRVEFETEPAAPAGGKETGEPATEEIKASIAEKVRADAEERAALTHADTLFALVPDSRKDAITAILDEMATDPRYADIKALPTASGMVFFFSKLHMSPDDAIAKSRNEEKKIVIAEKVREDSRDRTALTPAAVLHSLFPESDPEKVDAVLEEMRADARYADIKSVAASTGEVFFHSDLHMSGYYALVLGRVAAKDPCAAVAAMVRDESRIYPRPTCVQLFMEKPFDIPPCDLRAVVDATLSAPQFGDLKMIVHPSTGGVYLYSDRYLNAETAWKIMDWQEVGKDANP